MMGEALVFCEFLRWAMSGVVPSDGAGVICNYSSVQLLAKQFSGSLQELGEEISIKWGAKNRPCVTLIFEGVGVCPAAILISAPRLNSV